MSLLQFGYLPPASSLSPSPHYLPFSIHYVQSSNPSCQNANSHSSSVLSRRSCPLTRTVRTWSPSPRSGSSTCPHWPDCIPGRGFQPVLVVGQLPLRPQLHAVDAPQQPPPLLAGGYYFLLAEAVAAAALRHERQPHSPESGTGNT